METMTAAAVYAQETDLLAQELAFVVLLSLAALAAIIVRRIPLPYTVTLVLIGLALSLVPSVGIDLSSELILAILVPPLIFEATLSIKWRNLRENLAPVLLLAFVGTFIGTFIVAAIISFVGDTFIPELDIVLPAAIAFGALISATDPVAVIAFFRSLGVSKRLAVLVEGESLFNDGVAIVIFSIALTIGAAAAEGTGEAFSAGDAIIEFGRVALGGLAVGSILGYLVSAVVLKNVDDHLIETATSVALAFGSFVVAEEFHVSGVLAVVAAGLFVGNLGTQNTSPTTRITLENFWEFLAFVVNSLVFLLIGLEADLRQLQLNLPLLVVAIAAVLLSRAIVVYLLTWLHGAVDKNRRIPVAYRHIMYWGGLRGAISLALALSLSGEVFGRVVAQELQLMTFGVVLFTLLVQGTTIGPLIRRLGLAERSEQQSNQERQQALIYAMRAGKRELDRLYYDGILSSEIWQAMSEVYESQIQKGNQEFRDLLQDYPELEQTMVLQARKDALQAERTAIGDASRRGLISEEVYRQLIKETDNQAAALELIQRRMSAMDASGDGSEV
jgi:CPA1 family monovalent cation:H+ antiporter